MASRKKVSHKKTRAIKIPAALTDEQKEALRTKFAEHRVKEREESDERKRRIAAQLALPRIPELLRTDYSEAPSLDAMYGHLSMWEIKFLWKLNDSFKKRIYELEKQGEENRLLGKKMGFYKNIEELSKNELEEIIKKMEEILVTKEVSFVK